MCVRHHLTLSIDWMILRAAEPSRTQASDRAPHKGEPSMGALVDMVHSCLLDNHQPRLAVAKALVVDRSLELAGVCVIHVRVMQAPRPEKPMDQPPGSV
jgi:hypothetical protein